MSDPLTDRAALLDIREAILAAKEKKMASLFADLTEVKDTLIALIEQLTEIGIPDID